MTTTTAMTPEEARRITKQSRIAAENKNWTDLVEALNDIKPSGYSLEALTRSQQLYSCIVCNNTSLTIKRRTIYKPYNSTDAFLVESNTYVKDLTYNSRLCFGSKSIKSLAKHLSGKIDSLIEKEEAHNNAKNEHKRKILELKRLSKEAFGNAESFDNTQSEVRFKIGPFDLSTKDGKQFYLDWGATALYSWSAAKTKEVINLLSLDVASNPFDELITASPSIALTSTSAFVRERAQELLKKGKSNE